MTIIGLTLIFPSTEARGDQPVVVSKEAAQLLVPILDAFNKAKESQPVDETENSPSWHGATLLGALFKNRSSGADEALIALFDYYLGEANGADLLHEVTLRGHRILPYLQRFRYRRPQIPGRNYPRSMRLTDSVRAGFFEDAIRAILRGQIIGVD
jgi:hypothetical protein